MKSQTLNDYRNHVIKLINRNINVAEQDLKRSIDSSNSILPNDVSIHYFTGELNALRQIKKEIMDDKAYEELFK